MLFRFAIFPAALAALSISLLPACSGESGNGKLSLAVTDAPIDDLVAVVVKFEGVVLTSADGSTFELPIQPARQINLLALAGGRTETLLAGEPVPAGSYDTLELLVSANQDGDYDSYVTAANGAQYEIEIDESERQGLVLSAALDITPEGHRRFTVDFDLRKSFTRAAHAASAYKMHPAVRLVDDLKAGEITGEIANELITNTCSPGVYVFEGAGVTPDDLDGVEPDAITTAIPELEISTGRYRYRAAFLPPGPYTAVFMCSVTDDEPATNDTLIFGTSKDASVNSLQVTRVDFDS